MMGRTHKGTETSLSYHKKIENDFKICWHVPLIYSFYSTILCFRCRVPYRCWAHRYGRISEMDRGHSDGFPPSTARLSPAQTTANHHDHLQISSTHNKQQQDATSNHQTPESLEISWVIRCHQSFSIFPHLLPQVLQVLPGDAPAIRWNGLVQGVGVARRGSTPCVWPIFHGLHVIGVPRRIWDWPIGIGPCLYDYNDYKDTISMCTTYINIHYPHVHMGTKCTSSAKKPTNSCRSVPGNAIHIAWSRKKCGRRQITGITSLGPATQKKCEALGAQNLSSKWCWMMLVIVYI